MGLKRPEHLPTFYQGVRMSGGDSGRWWKGKKEVVLLVEVKKRKENFVKIYSDLSSVSQSSIWAPFSISASICPSVVSFSQDCP